MIELAAIKCLVQEQLAVVRDPDRREALRTRLVEPQREEREWDYGEVGARYPY